MPGGGWDTRRSRGGRNGHCALQPPGGSGGGGRDVEGESLARHSCSGSPGPSGSCGAPLRAGPRLLAIPERPHTPTPNQTLGAIRISACLMKSNNFISPHHTHTHTDIPPFGRTRSLTSSGTASCCFQTRAETDKEIVKEKFGVASYKTESSKNPRTFGSIPCLVNRTHLYSCVF